MSKKIFNIIFKGENIKMASLNYQIVNNQLIVRLMIWNPQDKNKGFQFFGIIDTGATSTCVNEKKLEKIGVQPHSTGNSITMNGTRTNKLYNVKMAMVFSNPFQHPQTKEVKTYSEAVDLGLVTVSGNPMDSTKLNNNFLHKAPIDAVIGMDIIRKGHLTVARGMFIFSI